MLTLQEMMNLVKVTRYHRAPLRVTPEFYELLKQSVPQADPIQLGPPMAPLTGVQVIVVTDGSENVVRINDSWVFINQDLSERLNRLLPPGAIVTEGSWGSDYWPAE